MENFMLDSRLASDCIEINDSKDKKILLMNNAYYIWFIIVPKTNHIELFELPENQKTEVLFEIDKLSSYIKSNYQIDKLNVAAIGNIVSQLHIHLVGRYKDDPAWPGVVWGHSSVNKYTKDELKRIKQSFIEKYLNILN